MTLDVYLHNTFCGKLQTTSDKGIIFEYAPEYLTNPSSIPLSLSLPLQKGFFSQKQCLPYFSGLLPEGNVKSQISTYLHVSESSTVKLLEALGGECAGTVFFMPENTKPENQFDEYQLTSQNYKSISTQQIAEMIDQIKLKPLVLSQSDFRLSLAGAQQKIALTLIDNFWYVPLGNAPSTHILKPSRTDFPNIAENEYISMHLASIFLNDVAETSLTDFCGKKVLCVKRFDRITTDNRLKRVHQEDMCQALGIMDDKKYQTDGGPSIKDILNLIMQKSTNPLLDVDKLLHAVVFQYLLGNCDAHGKNYSLLREKNKIILSPLYDIVATSAYPSLSQKLSMKIGNKYELSEITRNDFYTLTENCEIKTSVINKVFTDFEKKVKEAENFLNTDSVAIQNATLSKTILNGFTKRLFS